VENDPDIEPRMTGAGGNKSPAVSEGKYSSRKKHFLGQAKAIGLKVPQN
jgi:hypothetical protein